MMIYRFLFCGVCGKKILRDTQAHVTRELLRDLVTELQYYHLDCYNKFTDKEIEIKETSFLHGTLPKPDNTSQKESIK